MDNPLFAAATAARASRYARPSQSGYEPQVAQPEESDRPEPVQQKSGFSEPSSILKSAGSAAASGLSAVANLLDLPGSMGRDLATLLPGGMKPQNPFDQILDPFGARAHENRIEGRDLLRSHGLAGKRDTWGNFATGLVLEMATDPLTYTGLGVLGKGAGALSKAGILGSRQQQAALFKEMAEAAGRSGKKIGRSGSAKKATGAQLFEHWKTQRDNIIKDSTVGKIDGKRLSGKNTWGSLDELEDLNPDALKPNHWAVVDKDGKYDVMQWQVDEKGAGKWARLDEPSEAIMARLRLTASGRTLDTMRNAYKSQFEMMYKGEDHLEALNKPLESIISFKLPFGTRTLYDVNVPDAGPAFDRWVEKQPKIVKNNKMPGGGPVDDVPLKGKAKTSFDDEIEANADKWGLRNADGTIKRSSLGDEATRVLHQAARVFGKEAVDTWDIIETAGVGAAKMNDMEPEDFFKQITIDTGTARDKVKLRKGQGLEQGAAAIETPEFKQWFGDWQADVPNASKVVDESGKPLRVYHGTTASDDFNVFHGNQHFGDVDAANSRLDDVYNETGSAVGSRVMPVYLDIKNPKILNYDAYDDVGWADEVAKAKAEGFDGIQYPNEIEGGISYITFSPNQIKSATGNSGAFDAANPSILGQESKGAIFITATQKAIKSFETGDISTLQHEFAHAVRSILKDDVLEQAELAIEARMKQLGRKGPLKDGNKWTVEAEEIWARTWEKYLKDGKLPKGVKYEGLRQAFKAMRDWLLDIYRQINKAHPAIAKKINKETRDLFDAIIQRGDDELRPKAAGVPNVPVPPPAAAAAVPPASAFDEFVATGNVAPETLADIAKKIAAGARLAPEEQAILSAKGPEIEKALADLKAASAAPGPTPVTPPSAAPVAQAAPPASPVATPAPTASGVDILTGRKPKGRTAASAAAAAKVADELPPTTADLADDVAKELSSKAPQVEALDNAPYVPPAVNSVEDGKRLINKDSSASNIEAVLERARPEDREALAAYALTKKVAPTDDAMWDNAPVLDDATGELVEASQVVRQADEVVPQQVDGLQRAKGKPRSIEDRLPVAETPATPVDATVVQPIQTGVDALIEKAAPTPPARAKVSLGGLAKKAADKKAAAEEASKKAEETLKFMRMAVDGDEDALTELLTDPGLARQTKAAMDLEKKRSGKALVLANALKHDKPDEIAKQILAVKKAKVDVAAKRAKEKAAQALTTKIHRAAEEYGVIEEMQGLFNKVDDADAAAISIVQKWVKAASKEGIADDLALEQAKKIHKRLKTDPDKDSYFKAWRNMARKADDAIEYTDAEKEAAARYIEDPDFTAMPESDILSPAPPRLQESSLPTLRGLGWKKTATKRAFENERAVDRHLFRKMNYLKKAGRTKEAEQVRNEIAEHYAKLPAILAQAVMKGTGDNGSKAAELASDGLANLLSMVQNFDYTRNFRFATYATPKLKFGNLDFWKKQQKLMETTGGEDDVIAQALANAVKSGDDEFQEMTLRQYDALLDNLSEKQGDVLKMRFVEGLEYKQIAERIGRAERTAKRWVEDAIEEAKKFDFSEVERAFSQADNPKPSKSAMRLLYEQNAEAIGKVMENIQDESLRARYTNMLDLGEHLFTASPAVRAFNRYFDRSVYGQYDYDAQQLARKRFKAAERAVFESRQLMGAITQAIAEHGFLDADGAARQFIGQGEKAASAKAKARTLINKRNAELVRYMEGAVDAQGVKTGLSRELFGGEELAAKMENLLKVVKTFFPARLREQGLAGLANRKLVDEYIEYFPRLRHFEYGPRVKGVDDVEQLFDTTLRSQSKRKLAFRDVPGGRAVLDELSVDPEISGIYWDQLKLGKKLSRHLLEKSRDRLLQDKYRLRVFDPLKHFEPDGTLNKAGKKKGAQVAAAMAQLPKAHSANNIPIFGNNILHDISKYIQDSIAMEGVARAAQEVVADNILPAVSKSEYTLQRLFKEINLDKHQSYLNVIDSAGKRTEYNAYAKGRIARIKKGLKAGKTLTYNGKRSKLSLTDDGQIQAVDIEDVLKPKGDDVIESTAKTAPRIISESQLASEINFGRDFSDRVGRELTVNKDTYDVATQYLSAWKTPKPIGDVNRFFRSMLNLFKTNVTLPFPAFHIRNFLSGQVQNFFYGAFSARSVKMAWDMRNGKTVNGLYEYLPKHIREQVDSFDSKMPRDEAATNWAREQVFKYGITGDKQGYAAEQLGESYSSFVSAYPGYKQRQQTAKNLYGLLREPQVGVSIKDRANLLHVRGGGRPAIVQDDLGKASLGIKPYEETTSTLHRTGEDLALVTEEVNRIAPFLAILKQGTLPDEAARRVQRIQINYSDLSETEKSIRNVVPFYTFSSKVMHLTLGDLITNPGGKQAWAIRATNRAQDPESLAPDYLKRGVAIPFPEQTATGADRYLSGLGLPFEDPLQFAGILRGDARGAAGEIVGRVRPELQGLAELATGRSLFFDRELEDMDPPVGRLLSNVEQGFSGEERKGLAPPVLNSPGLEWLIGKTPASRYIGTLVKATDGRKDVLTKLLNLASGIKVTDIEPEARERIAVDMASDLLKEYGGREFSRTYVPDWAKERLSEERALQVDAIQSFIQDVQKETRNRKKAAEGLAGAMAGAAGDFQQ